MASDEWIDIDQNDQNIWEKLNIPQLFLNYSFN